MPFVKLDVALKVEAMREDMYEWAGCGAFSLRLAAIALMNEACCNRDSRGVYLQTTARAVCVASQDAFSH